MPRDNLLTRIELTRIHCHDEGDGLGSAEPYLWAVFFAVGGSTVAVSPGLMLVGQAVTHTTPGSHGNLVNTDVDGGEDVPIPSQIGEWQTILAPIPVPDSLSGAVDDVGGVVGVVVVLMEEDNVTDDGAESGHDAFDAAVREAINSVVATRTVTNQEISDEELAAFEDQVAGAVEDAVAGQQNVFENVWSWLNADDTIGFKAFIFSHDELAAQGTIEFSHRWKNEGDWEISGAATAARTCSAEALQDVFDRLLPTARGSSIDSLRKFRDGEFRKHEGLLPWWRLLERNTPAIALLLSREPDLRESARELFAFVASAPDDLAAPLDASVLRNAARLAQQISRRTRSRRLRIDAGRLADVLPEVEGATIGEGIASLARLEPARNAPAGGDGKPRRRRSAIPTPRQSADVVLQDADALRQLLEHPREWLDSHGLTQRDVECGDAAHAALDRSEDVAAKANELAGLPLLDALPRLHELATTVWGDDVEVSRIPFGVRLAERPIEPGPVIDDNPGATTGTGSIRCTFGLKCKADVDR